MPASALTLALHLAIVSPVSFGGFPTMLPDVHAFVVDAHGWITDEDFANIFAMAQAMPGPNMILMMGLIGWQVWACRARWRPRRQPLHLPAPFISERTASSTGFAAQDGRTS
jgi:hypothetical protein